MFIESANLLLGKRIFIVEDDVINIFVLSKPLSMCGAQVYTNYNSIGIELHIIQNLPIDIILMDIMLRNGVNGYDTFKSLQSNPDTRHIPVVAVTSLEPEIEIPKAISMGFAGFISKPIDLRTFAQDISDIIKGRKKWI